ncbi:MAG TPA: hypothetical protein VMW56_22720 [Candidatus Margulisiibacteriota bacterium]|nr:hypothetical protein [Candidatus Margulisiibacteriota bacterium]
MQHDRIRQRVLAALLLLGVPQFAFATFESVRGWEVVTIEGREFPAAFRVAVGRLTLWRMTGGTLAPVPFQVDERDASGQLALPNGPEPSQDESPGVFDDNDLLVFAARDLGERAPVTNAVEIQVTDPLTGESRWAYLRLDVATPACTPEDVEYDAGARLVRARAYSLTLGTHVPTAFRFMDGHRVYGRNLLDRLKVRVTAHVFWGLLQFHRNEDDVTTELLAWKGGPVRVIQRSQLKVRLGYGLSPPKIVAEDFYTADTFESPIIVRLPFDLRYVFGDLTVRIFLDFDGLRDSRIFANGQPPEPIGCDHPAPGVNGIATNWFGVTGPEGTFVHALRVSPTLRTLRSALYAVADRSPDPPERVPGNCPGVGYTLTQWGGMSRGTHQISMVIRAFEHFVPGDERAFLASLDNALLTTVRAIPK